MGGYLEGRVKYSVFEYSEQRDESVENMNISRGKAGLEEHSHQQAEVTRQETLSVSGVQKNSFVWYISIASDKNPTIALLEFFHRTENMAQM